MNPDVVIIGAGPAGMAAALALDEAGAGVRLVDEQAAPGGQIYRAVERVSKEHPESLELFGPDYANGLDMTRQLAGSRVMRSFSTSVWDISTNETGLSIGLVSGDKAELVNPKQIIIATGAMERPTPFPGWTLPGVMTVGAAQTLLKESALIPDSQPVIAGTGPLVYLFARQMIAAGVKPAIILDTGPKTVAASLWGDLMRAFMASPGSLLKGRAWFKDIQRAGVHRQTGTSSIRAKGDNRLQSIEYCCGDRVSEIEADLLLVHDGVIPNSHLALAAGCKHHWNEIQKCWDPLLDEKGRSSKAGISIAGDGGGIAGADAAVCSGSIVGWHVAVSLGLVDVHRCEDVLRRYQQKNTRLASLRRFLDHHYKPTAFFQVPAEDETIVCRCENITAGEIKKVAALGCMGPNQGKAFTRCGMGPCMGRQCGNTVSQLFAQQLGRDVADIGHYRIRPPIRPLSVEQLANIE